MPVQLPPIAPTAEARQPALEAALAAIRAGDPGFDERLFVRLVQAEFYRVRQARQERNPQSLRAYLGPALLRSWAALADRQRADGVIMATTGLQVDDMRLMWAAIGPAGSLITVGIDGAGVVQAVREDTREPVFGDTRPQPITEYWTWSRPPGARTDPDPAIRCPNCGAPVTPEDGALCHFCGAGLPGPMRGLVLERVDEQLEWAEGPAR